MGGNKHHGLRLVAVLAFSAGIFFFLATCCGLLCHAVSCLLNPKKNTKAKKKWRSSLSLSLTN